MKRTTKRLLAVVLSLCVLTLVGVIGFSLLSPKASPTDSQRASAAASRQIASPPVEFAKAYTSIPLLAEDSDLVIEGTVKDTKNYVSETDTAYTLTTVHVERSWTDKIPAGSDITIAEIGGTMKESDWLRVSGRASEEEIKAVIALEEKGNENTTKVTLDGLPLPKVGDRAIYFLSAGDASLFPDIAKAAGGEYFDVVGAYQGKLMIEDGMVASYSPAMPGESAVTFKPMKLNDAEAEITKLLGVQPK